MLYVALTPSNTHPEGIYYPEMDKCKHQFLFVSRSLNQIVGACQTLDYFAQPQSDYAFAVLVRLCVIYKRTLRLYKKEVGNISASNIQIQVRPRGNT